MHFRARNNVVQVIRTSYDADTKKAKGLIVARLSRVKPELSAEIRQALTAAEVAEVQAWIDGQNRLQRLNAEHAAWNLAGQLEQAAQWFAEAGDNETSRQLAAQAQQGWQQLRAVLKRSKLAE